MVRPELRDTAMTKQTSTASSRTSSTHAALAVVPTPALDSPSSAAKPTRHAARRGRPRKSTRAGFGSVRRLPSGRYQARYSDEQGQRYTAPHTFEAKRAAEDWLATQQADLVRGTWRAPALGAVTLVDYATNHLTVRLDLRPKTRDTYDSLLRTLLCANLELPPGPGRRARTINLGKTEIGSIHLATVREWHAAALHRAARNAQERNIASRSRREREAVHHARAWARAQGIAVKDTGRIPAAVRDAWLASGAPAVTSLEQLPDPSPDAGRTRVAQAYRLLHMLMQQAVQEGRITANPCQLPRAGQAPTSERVPATPAQVAALAQAMPSRYAAAVYVAAWSGLRAGELFGLARRHVDLAAGTVRVERAAEYRSDTDRAPALGPTKTTSSLRTVHLPSHVVSILAEHMARYTAPGDAALVFTDERGQIVPRSVRGATFRRARASIGRPDLRWHDLRHTGATLAAQAGATIRELQARLGHSTYAAAMRYQSASAERDRDLALRLDAMAHGS